MNRQCGRSAAIIRVMTLRTRAVFVVGLSVLAVVAAGTAVTPAQQPPATAAPVAPRLTFAFELRVRVGNPIEVGQVAHGRRRIVPIDGGTIKGPMLNGTVPAGGADWQTIQADGFTELDTRYMIRTGNGDLIYVQNGGIRTEIRNGGAGAAVARQKPVRRRRRTLSERSRDPLLQGRVTSAATTATPSR